MKKILTLAGVAFIGCIVLANYVTTEFGMVPVGFGLTATAGTYIAGVTFVLRDLIQDTVWRLLPTYTVERTVYVPVIPGHPGGGYKTEIRSQEYRANRWHAAAPVLVFIGIGALLSYLLSDPFIALASGVAFLVSETCDLLIYTPLRVKGYVRAALASNFVGALVDTVLFLWIAGFPVHDAIAGQMVGKMAVTGVALAGVWAYRARKADLA